MKNRCKEFREKFNFTQQDLAEKVGVSRQTIISLENGKYKPSIFLAYKISKVFNSIIEDIFIFEEEKTDE
ncbi:helix-turn-helix transcriptional regulator [Priestia megaterium]|uniref:helix-turn-helix transcriptional regulator n=1 Tax=Priestia megaterium TaxID=1404 RepID=UPI002E1E82DF|nr:helix-turn-helix transcriptional regulator [Priestia megaterium]